MRELGFKYLVVLILFVGLLGGSVVANSGRLVEISEISWSGTSASWADEWIELQNVSEEDVDLAGWSLSWEGVQVDLGKVAEDTLKARESVLAPGEVFLLERSDDETVSSLKAEVVYKGSLSNSGEKLVLEDDEGNEIQVLDCTEGWPAGTSSDGEPGYASMVLKKGEWVTHKNKGGQHDANDNLIYGSPGKPQE